MCELSNPELNCNGNDVLDACELADDPTLDCDFSGTLDECELSNPELNCNGNELIDSCEIADGLVDDPSVVLG